MPETMLERYRAMIRSGEIGQDQAQAQAAEKLQLLAGRLASYTPPADKGIFAFLTRRSREAPRGVYIYGRVGRGKTMLMDLFFASVPYLKKRRVHFHEFMSDTHELIAAARKSHPGDPVPQAAETIARDAQLLCFDELQVTDIADAMILGRLFSVLFERGTVIVATSNAAPWELYRNGLNRGLFLPFVELIEAHMEVIELESARDYRLDRLSGASLYFTPLGAEAETDIRKLWRVLTGRDHGERQTLTVKGREVEVPETAMGVARFTFEDLCAKPLGANDYLAIARNYHTLFIENVPILTPARRNEARRFNTLIDALYDQRVGLVMSAAAEPDALYPAGDGADLFQRTASRLMEMRTEAYLGARHEQRRIPPRL